MQTSNGIIKIVHVSTDKQLADVMTKLLSRELFEKFRDIITCGEVLEEQNQAIASHSASIFRCTECF